MGAVKTSPTTTTSDYIIQTWKSVLKHVPVCIRKDLCGVGVYDVLEGGMCWRVGCIGGWGMLKGRLYWRVGCVGGWGVFV